MHSTSENANLNASNRADRERRQAEAKRRAGAAYAASRGKRKV